MRLLCQADLYDTLFSLRRHYPDQVYKGMISARGIKAPHFLILQRYNNFNG